MIGALIRMFRTERGVGVLELAQKLGVNRVSLFRIEREQRRPSEKTAIEAFKALGLSEENIYHIFVFNDLIKRGGISRPAKQREAASFLKRLRAKNGNDRILYRYFNKLIRR